MAISNHPLQIGKDVKNEAPNPEAENSIVPRSYADYTLDNSTLRVKFPKGGAYSSGSNSATGAFKIKLPAKASNSMIKIRIEIYEFKTDEAISIILGGYNSATWQNVFTQITGSKTDRDFTIRFGNDGVNDCVWIGEVDSVWNYPKITVSEIIIGHSTIDALWARNWNIDLTTAFDTIDVIKTNNFPYADFNKLKNKPNGSSGSFTTADGKTVTVTDGLITSIV